ncbi:putative spermidine/putrescine transport system substrate-binding protein/spermidine/putrescine transport system substrate-binding protein [Paenibacillus forsythiae]|uniref:Spermidine/putrescine transport system substrate-binding protein/spermidine/putrescine transport system substrate-binding protein n=1 Tax=Paenibacillus forsythiae TaxID=365616 RepID=A0ABU3HAU7_9BACL|nr:extracellular solute-binding protein [Paenibacillus forsythiae]MDT3427939.1 putative spermidine/putrescine transport system substrate-binding protein/spermidine/putrescine transport system substrate-binding protein [Paenibacillus forsythiae]
MKLKHVLIVLMSVVILVGLSGCGGNASSTNTGAGTASSAAPSNGGEDLAKFKGETINVLSWEGYQEEEWVKPFEQKYGVTVKVTYAGSVDEMFAKAASGSVKYDLIFMDGGSVSRYHKMDLIQPIDLTKLKNTSQLIANMKSLNDKHVVKDGKTYAVPFAWGSLPMMVNTDKIKEPIDSWNALWDPKYSGKIVTLDDAANQTAMTAMLLGFEDPYNLTDEQLTQVKNKLLEQKPLVRTYYAGFEDGKNLMASDEGWIGFSMGPTMITDLQKEGKNVVEVIPKEGALVWIDNAVLGKDAKDPELVHVYIDYLISSEVQAQLIKKTSYGGVNADSATMLTDEEKKVSHMDDPNYFNNLVYVAFPESFEKRVKLWNEVKAAQ